MAVIVDIGLEVGSGDVVDLAGDDDHFVLDDLVPHLGLVKALEVDGLVEVVHGEDSVVEESRPDHGMLQRGVLGDSQGGEGVGDDDCVPGCFGGGAGGCLGVAFADGDRGGRALQASEVGGGEFNFAFVPREGVSSNRPILREKCAFMCRVCLFSAYLCVCVKLKCYESKYG